MSSWKWIQTAFWIFVGIMILWQFQTYNHKIDVKVAAAGPQQQQFFFTSQTMAPPPPPPKPDAADVKQIAFSAEEGKPFHGQFVCHVTLQNQGKLKAVEVRIMVAPFHGVLTGNDSRDPDARSLTPSDPAYNVNQWLSFPDLAPGEKATRDITFYDQDGITPGDNPQPQIQFQTVKPQAAPPAPEAPPTR